MRRALRWLILGVSLAVLIVLISPKDFFGFGHRADQPYSEDYQRLLDSLGRIRPVEARVSGGSSYRPYRPICAIRPSMRDDGTLASTRGGAAPALEASSGVPVSGEVAGAIHRAAQRESSPENQAALGVLNLVEGRLDKAVRPLRKAHARKPDDPRFLNDLAVALLTVSEATGDPWPALEALDLAQRAVHLEPSLPALFNQALALEGLGLRARAIAAWRRYLDQDARSAWAQEAAQRLNRLEQEVPTSRAWDSLLASSATDLSTPETDPWVARVVGERVLLTRWAEQALAGQRDDAEATLAQAEVVAPALPGGGGRLLEASTLVIRDAQQAGDRARLDRLAHGHQAFGRASSLAREEQTAAARAILDSAIADLRVAKSPFELRARVLRAWLVNEPDWAELQALDVTAEKGRFPSISAEARRIAAFRISLEGRLEAAVYGYRDAQRRFEALGERESSAVVAAMTAELLGLLGREHESAAEMNAALAAGPWVADPFDRYSIYVVAASAAAGQFSRAAVELRLEAADACQDLPKRPLCAVDSWLRVAALTPDVSVAKDALDHAGELLLSAPDSEGKGRTEIDLATSRARWLSGDDRSTTEWEEAIELLSQIAAGYKARGLAVPEARARAARAQVLQRLGREEEASAEYREGLQLFRLWEQNDHFGPKHAERHSPRELRKVYEEFLKMELDVAGNSSSPAAFLLSEEMRDRLAPRKGAGLWLPKRKDIDRFTSGMPADTAIVEYAILGERAVAWILSRGRLDQVILTPKEKLGQRIRSLSRERELDAWKRNSGALFQDLLTPVVSRLPAGTEHLILIPDSELYGVPFRALWDSASSRYLDEMFLVSFAPSVRQLLDFGRDRRAVLEHQGLSLLSLGFSSFLPDLGLKALPRAAMESLAVREVYESAVDGCRVNDWSSFLRCAPTADVLHLATHASANPIRSEWSWLAFPKESINLDRLWQELPNLPRHPLIVLSACESVAGAGGEGLGGLARPFLARGARTVVGTLWDIDDADAADLFVVFHQAYRESHDPAEALSKAREDLENWDERPWIWGGVEVMSAGLQ